MKLHKKLGAGIVSALLTLGLAVGTAAPAFAYVEQAETEKPVQVVEETSPEPEEMTPFSIPGNGEVLDDIAEESSKEFFTITTKGGNTFFLVIDRASNSENVYMLSMIDEYDLQEFLDDEARNEEKEEEPAVVIPEATPEPEPTPVVEVEEKKASNKPLLFLIFAAALVGGGAFFYFYIYRPKHDEDEPQSENLETDEGLRTENEDEAKRSGDE